MSDRPTGSELRKAAHSAACKVWPACRALLYSRHHLIHDAIDAIGEKADDAEQRADRLQNEIETAQEIMEKCGLREHKFTVAGAIKSLADRLEEAERKLSEAIDSGNRFLVRAEKAEREVERLTKLFGHMATCEFCAGHARGALREGK